jgi:HSP20 family protein
MAVVKWDPFRELDEIQSRFNCLLHGRTARQTDDDEMPFADWSPAADVQETDTEYLIKADLPDVAKEDLKLQMEEGVLTLQGERRKEKEEDGKRFYKIERQYGKFVRRFALPIEVDAARVKADFNNGVLSVHLPKSQTAIPRAIDVKIA